MSHANFIANNKGPLVVGSLANAYILKELSVDYLALHCDVAEIRLDLLEVKNSGLNSEAWAHLTGFPLLFTARRFEEGGAVHTDALFRSELLRNVLSSATWVDIEVASIEEMSALVQEVSARDIPWIASFHDFDKLPSYEVLTNAATKAREAGASVFKIAAMVHSPADIARLAEFQLEDHGLAVATMGMGPLAPISRLLCAQCGSLLNYGYIGDVPTAPGQWDSQSLREAISKLTPFRAKVI